MPLLFQEKHFLIFGTRSFLPFHCALTLSTPSYCQHQHYHTTSHTTTHCLQCHHTITAATTTMPMWIINDFPCEPNGKMFLRSFSESQWNTIKNKSFFHKFIYFAQKTFSTKTNRVYVCFSKAISMEIDFIHTIIYFCSTIVRQYCKGSTCINII